MRKSTSVLSAAIIVIVRFLYGIARAQDQVDWQIPNGTLIKVGGVYKAD
ncbi:MAG: hypothetical protein HQK95_03195 [Nitrospirae bacterium]|nr:hypothetical protein [Nitrospirota bacterium]